MRKIIIGLLAVLVCGSSAMAGRKDGMIQIKGSDTMVNLSQAWAEAFMQRSPDAVIAVTGGGSGTGISALINGTCDIAQASRSMTEKEVGLAKKNGHEPKECEVAIDALSVVVHPSNPVAKLTIDQLSDIYTGKITNWKEIGGNDRQIVVLSRERNSGTHVYFLEHVLRRGNAKGPEEYASGVLMMPSSQAIADEVSSNPDAIGYFGLGYLTGKEKAIAVAKDSASEYVSPGFDTASSGKYPVARALLIYTDGEPKGAVKGFLDFVLSDDGQKIVKDLDFVPLPKKQ
ncbi:MAG TPA: PstS family phosphate ABC transporter substrate-binding protein [bacterium]|nr:PstS family phosphate ABC transporter substrate-binding protein [bacterium]